MSIVNFWSRSADNQNRFEDLVGPHIDHLYRLSYRFTGSREDAEDLVQDLLVKLYPRQEEMEAVEKLRPWLARVLYRLFIDRVRQAGRSVLSVVEEAESPDDQADTSAGIESLVDGTLTQERLLESFALLNDDQRALLALHDIEGYTLAELAETLDTPVGTLKSRLNRARKKLKSHLSTEPFSESRRVNQ
jgi:RNA polymerase sigma factor (sigma-70 family)